MESSQAVQALAALAQETRLGVFRALVVAGPEGLAAGALSEALRVPPPTLSFHLKELERAGLVAARRERRHVIYTAAFGTMQSLIGFLTQDCCGGHPEVCAPLQAAAEAACC